VIDRQALQDRLIAQLAARPEIRSVYTFGRAVSGQPDAYPDLDLVIASSDRPQTQRVLPELFAAISPVRSQLILASSPDLYAAMVMLRDCSPYQKIDLSIIDHIESQARFGPFLALYENSAPTPTNDAPLPIIDLDADLQNQLNDILFSIPRFAKCLFRHDPYLYQRFYATVENTLTLLYESHHDWQMPKRAKLNSREYQQLYAGLKDAERSQVEKILPFDARPDIPQSFLACIDLLLDLYQTKAQALNLSLDDAFNTYIRNFLSTEIRRFRTLPTH